MTEQLPPLFPIPVEYKNGVPVIVPAVTPEPKPVHKPRSRPAFDGKAMGLDWPTTKAFFAKSVQPLVDKIALLEARVVELQQAEAKRNIAKLFDLFNRLDSRSKRLDEKLISADLGTVEHRLTKLENDSNSTRFAGAWQRSSQYHRNQLVVHSSALWIAVERDVEPNRRLGSATNIPLVEIKASSHHRTMVLHVAHAQ